MKHCALAGALLVGLLTLVAGYGVPSDTDRWTRVKRYLQSAQAREQSFRLLKHFVAMKSTKRRCGELDKAVDFLLGQLRQLGANFPMELEDSSMCGKNIIAQIGADPSKKTILVYFHYDVVPVGDMKEWTAMKDPFNLEVREGANGEIFYYGRGASDDKGQVIAWLEVVRAWQEYGDVLPVNLKFLIDKGEETGSRVLAKQLTTDNDLKKFITNSDALIFTDGVGMNDRTPSLILGLRGINYYIMTVSGPRKNFHSGTYGGILYEPMTDVVQLLASLQDDPVAFRWDQKERLIRVPSLYDGIRNDYIDYDHLDFDVDQMKREVNVSRFLYNRKADVLRHLWSLPSLSIHNIKSNAKSTTIPNSVTAMFSIRLVAGQTRENSKRLVEQYLQRQHQQRGSPNTLKLMEMGAEPWSTQDINSKYFKAMERALYYGWKRPNNRVRSGGTIGVIHTLDQIADEVPVIMIPLGRNSDSMHGPNERMAEENISRGSVVLARALMEFANVD